MDEGTGSDGADPEDPGDAQHHRAGSRAVLLDRAGASVTALPDSRAALPLVAPNVHRTPLLTSRILSEETGFDVRLKAEIFQRTGSYKIRGPLVKLSRLSQEERDRGVVCSSAGNHAQGVALAAAMLGVRAVVCTPRAQNPTGASLSERRAQELRDVLREHPYVLVIEDDHFSMLSRSPFRSLIGPDHRRWALVRSVSKFLGPDMCLAVTASDPETARRLAMRLTPGTTWVSHLLQRLALARALACQADVLLADDVSSALDAATEVELWRALRERGATVVGATSKAAALAQADRVVVLADGRIAATGTWSELSSAWGHLAG